MLKHLLLACIFLGINSNIHSMEADIDDKLYASAARGKVKRVNELLQLDANPNHFHPIFQESVLHAACVNGHLEIVQSLLNAGADCNVRTKNGGSRTPLMGAVYSGKLAVVRALLKKGAWVNAKCISGCTAMNAAALDDYIDIGLELLRYGASLEGTHTSWQLKLQEALPMDLQNKKIAALFLNQTLEDIYNKKQ